MLEHDAGIWDILVDNWQSSLLNVGLDHLVCSHLRIPGINGSIWGVYGVRYGVSSRVSAYNVGM